MDAPLTAVRAPFLAVSARRGGGDHLLPGQSIRQLQADPGGAPAPRVVVSPIIGGRALTGPADQMLAGFGHGVSTLGVARLYAEILDGLVLDDQDAAIEAVGLRVLVTGTIMGGEADRRHLGEETLAFARSSARARGARSLPAHGEH
jgi:LPPG:FO 2-phospho-L-lactate transferase